MRSPATNVSLSSSKATTSGIRICGRRWTSRRPFPPSSQLVRRPIRARHELDSPRVVQYLLLRHVPVQLAAHDHGNESEVAGQRGVMRGLDRRDGRLARAHAIEEVAAVFGRLVELDLAQVFRERVGLY